MRYIVCNCYKFRHHIHSHASISHRLYFVSAHNYFRLFISNKSQLVNNLSDVESNDDLSLGNATFPVSKVSRDRPPLPPSPTLSGCLSLPLGKEGRQQWRHHQRRHVHRTLRSISPQGPVDTRADVNTHSCGTTANNDGSHKRWNSETTATSNVGSQWWWQETTLPANKR